MNTKKIIYRTDLAIEAGDMFTTEELSQRGVEFNEHLICDEKIKITHMKVLTNEASASINKPPGNYITIEAADMSMRELSNTIAKCLNSLIPNKNPEVLVSGLGNKNATPDSLGPLVIENLYVTRHITKYMGYDEVEGARGTVSCIVPGVMAQTGMDTCEILKGIINSTKPDVLIVVDALATRSADRLNSTIQLTDTGIHPGSGVGNDRLAINEKSMGIPVIAIGVPTVVDASTLIYDATLCDSIPDKYNGMYVTSKDIDQIIKKVGNIISDGINIFMGFGI